MVDFARLPIWTRYRSRGCKIEESFNLPTMMETDLRMALMQVTLLCLLGEAIISEWFVDCFQNWIQVLSKKLNFITHTAFRVYRPFRIPRNNRWKFNTIENVRRNVSSYHYPRQSEGFVIKDSFSSTRNPGNMYDRIMSHMPFPSEIVSIIPRIRCSVNIYDENAMLISLDQLRALPGPKFGQ